jgi:hypothetical protein
VAGEDRYTLKFRARDYGELEDITDLTAGKLEQAFREGDIGFNTLHGMIWASTRKYHRQELRTEDEVWDVIDEIMQAGEYQEAWKSVIEAYGAGQNPNADQEASENGSSDSSAGEAPKGKRGKAKVTAVPEPEVSTGSGS